MNSSRETLNSFSIPGILTAQVDVPTKELLVLPGQNATFMCRVGVPLQYCRVEVPGFRTYNLNKGSVDKDVSITFLYSIYIDFRKLF